MGNTIIEHVKSFASQNGTINDRTENSKHPNTWKSATIYHTSAEVHHNMRGGVNEPSSSNIYDQRVNPSFVKR